ncbi:MAG: cbb3-type cytochrome oxidase assembly protein CcoS [Pseudomonadales bacterium]|nr:cbb3-type cytochrome oxidase assembly protein CcoS [Pseudomonadales bacterium]
MEAIFFLVPLSIGIIFMAIIAFVWSVHDGQYDDMDKEASRILLDEDEINNSK